MGTIGGRGSTRRRRVAAALTLAALVLPACSAGGRSPGAVPQRQREEVQSVAKAFFDDPTGYNDDVRSMLVRVHRVPVVTRYQHTTPSTPWPLARVTTPVVGLLVGTALDSGKVAGIDATLGELLPRYRAVMSRSVRAVTLRQVLSMTGGFRDDAPAWRRAQAGADVDWVSAALRSRTAPVDRFAWSDAGTHLLSEIVAEATGVSLLTWGRTTLFGPLGITDLAWARDPQGRELGYSGLRLRPADLARIGELVLARGRWHGTQVVSSSWVREATGVQASFERVTEPTEWFGYGWWVLDADGHIGVAGADPGQLLELVPDEGLVVVLTSRVRPSSRVGVLGPMSWVAQLLVPALARGD